MSIGYRAVGTQDRGVLSGRSPTIRWLQFTSCCASTWPVATVGFGNSETMAPPVWTAPSRSLRTAASSSDADDANVFHILKFIRKHAGPPRRELRRGSALAWTVSWDRTVSGVHVFRIGGSILTQYDGVGDQVQTAVAQGAQVLHVPHWIHPGSEIANVFHAPGHQHLETHWI